MGRSKSAVPHNTMDIVWQFKTRCHQNCSCTHGYAAQVDWDLVAAAVDYPIDPIKTIIAFDWAKPNIITAAATLPPLLRIQHAAIIFSQKSAIIPKSLLQEERQPCIAIMTRFGFLHGIQCPAKDVPS